MKKTGKRKKRRVPHAIKAGNGSYKEVAYQNKDITSKVLAEYFKGKTFRVYGLDIPEIKTVLPTNIPVVRANELRLDNLFELVDGTVAIVDYESEYKKEDKVKYLNYLTGIANRYLREKRDCPVLRMIVIYTGDISRKQVSGEYNIGAVKVTLHPAFLSELDSDKIYRCLRSKVEKNQRLDDEDLMKFIILPLSYQKREEKEKKIREIVKLATQIFDRSQQLFALAGILVFTDKLIDRKTADEIRRAIEMTQVERIFEEEKMQALAEMEARREIEMTQVAKIFEEEKKQALAELEARRAIEMTQVAKIFEEEKKQALAEMEAKILSQMAKKEEERTRELVKMEEEKRQAARESVIKMIRKNYSSEEIAYIISGFSLDDIEEMRKEIAGAE